MGDSNKFYVNVRKFIMLNILGYGPLEHQVEIDTREIFPNNYNV
jgi:hypothetical protein